jgi:hypothetical protein
MHGPRSEEAEGAVSALDVELPSEWREWSRHAADGDPRVHGFGRLLHARIRYVDEDCGACFASVATLARTIGACERTVQRWLRKLESWGYVLRLDREWKSGMRRSHVLVPVAPVNPEDKSGRDVLTRIGMMRRAWDHASRCARSWLPSWGLRSAHPTPPQKPIVSRGDTMDTVTNRSWFEADEFGDAASIFASWGTASGPGPGDPGWRGSA